MSAQITELGRLQSVLSDSDRGGEAIALEILGAETAKAAAPAGDEPAFATEMAAEGVVELAHGSAAGSVGPEVGVVEHSANSPGNESDALDSIGVWLLTVQHLSR